MIQCDEKKNAHEKVRKQPEKVGFIVLSTRLSLIN